MSLNILITDDSATSRSYVKRNIELADLETVQYFQAKNGREAYDLLKTQKIELLFLDINMPEMSGVELLEKMSGDGMLEGIRVVIISSEASENRKEQLKQFGVTEFIRKPFAPSMFNELINRLVYGVKL